jgi:rRNA maturation protein Rpf1
MSVFVTTSRKPSQLTRRVARFLGRVTGKYENRGKRSLAEVAARAGAAGYSRLLLVYEMKGNPSVLSFYEGGWLEPLIELRGLKEHGGKAGKGFAVKGPEWAKKLFGESEAGENVITVEKDKLFIECGGERVGPEFKAKVVYDGKGIE